MNKGTHPFENFGSRRRCLRCGLETWTERATMADGRRVQVTVYKLPNSRAVTLEKGKRIPSCQN